MELVRLQQLPRNFGQFADEIADGLGRLYGLEAAEDYRSRAPAVVRSNLAHPAVTGFAVEASSGEALGMALSVWRDGVGEVSFIHVLREHEGAGVEENLVRAAVSVYRKRAATRAIISDGVPLCKLNLAKAFEPLGFAPYPRQLMRADLAGFVYQGRSGAALHHVGRHEWATAARVLVDAYADHPGRGLHPEVHLPGTAEDFVRRICMGSYGRFRPAFARYAECDGDMAGVALGCEIAPRTGFVLQLAVHPAYQGQGIGRALLEGMARGFSREGMDRIALGVTCANPARHLYASAGLKPIQQTEAYAWWPEGNGAQGRGQHSA